MKQIKKCNTKYFVIVINISVENNSLCCLEEHFEGDYKKVEQEYTRKQEQRDSITDIRQNIQIKIH